MATHNQQPSDNFMPRKEFIRQSSRSLSSFALLTFSASSLIRLYAFPPLLVSSLRRCLDQRKSVAAFREDAANNFCEFVLHGKPWYSPKAIATERLIVNVIAVILQSGYTFLSVLDYGREQDDRMAIAFSRPRPPSPNTTGPTNSQSNMHNTLMPDASVQSNSSLPMPFIVPFAVSFTSATTLRVISPPLQSTPAILGAVRGAWPRGVASEKKVGDACYEFKLKGYRWFQEDTFAVDSLRQILNLLESLDSHSFTLLTSLSMSNRSRVKDLWIFTGISYDPSPDIRSYTDVDLPVSPPATPILISTVPMSLSLTKKKPSATDPEMSVPAHRKMSSVPVLHSPNSHPSFGTRHVRAATDGNVPRPVSLSHLHDVGLRRPGPRPHILVPVVETLPSGSNTEGERITLPSTVGSARNMTGVGAGVDAKVIAKETPDLRITPPELTEHPKDVLYAPENLSCLQVHEIRAPIPMLAVHTGIPLLRPSYGQESSAPSKSSSSINNTLLDASQYLEVPVQSDSSASSPKHWTPPVDQPRTPSPPPASPTPPPFGRYGQTRKESLTSSPLFGSGLYSIGNEENPDIDGFRDSAFTTGSDWKSCEIPIKWTGSAPEPKRRQSTGPSLFGVWDPSPVEEQNYDDGEEFQEPHPGERIPDTEDSDVPVQSSEPVQTEDKEEIISSGQREAGRAGLTPGESSAARTEKQNKLRRASDAWVMVTVKDPYLPVLEAQKCSGMEETHPSDPTGFSIHSTIKDRSSSENEETVNVPKLQEPSGTWAPAAKTITIGLSDTIERNNDSSPPLSPSSSPVSLPQPPKLKRLLPFSRKEKEDKPKAKGGLRQRWKKFGSTSKIES